MSLSVIGIILSLAFLIILALRGLHIIFIAPMAVILVSLFSGLDPFQTLVGPYMKGFVNFAGKFYLLFLAGSMFGKFLEDSGAARSIAENILQKIGTESQEKAIWAIAFICMVLSYGGVNLFVALFAIIPIARPVFKRLDIPWHIFAATQGLGLTAITMTLLPGSPSIQNIIPTKYLGTTPMAGATIGILGAIVVLAFNYWYIKFVLKRAKNRSEGYALTAGQEATAEPAADSKKDLPNLWLSLLPIVLVIILLNFVKLDVTIALATGVLTCAIIFWNKYEKITQTINKGALNTVVPVVNTCADVGYGMAIAATVGFGAISAWLLNMGGSPIISLSLATNMMAGITGSASGGLGIVMETLAPKYLELGLNPELIHRIAAMSSGCFDAMPHNGAIITLFALTGLNHGNAYHHIWWAHIVATLIALIVVIPIGVMLY